MRSMQKKTKVTKTPSRILGWAAAGALALGLSAFGCSVEQEAEGDMPEVDVSAAPGNLPEYEVEQTEEGRLPDVDVDVEGGEMPEYDVDTPDVDVETDTVEIPVPEDVDVDMPDDGPDDR